MIESKNDIWFLMVHYGPKNLRKLTAIKLSQKCMIFKLQQKAKKNQTRSLVDEITYIRKTYFFVSQLNSASLYQVYTWSINVLIKDRHERNENHIGSMRGEFHAVKLKLYRIGSSDTRITNILYPIVLEKWIQSDTLIPYDPIQFCRSIDNLVNW